MLTAVNDATSAALCMQRGALDYLIKPIDLSHLGRAIQSALRKRHTLLEGQQINQWLKEEVALRVAEKRLEQANQERISIATLDALVNALEAKDPYLRGHSARVADLSASVAAQLGCTDELIEAIRTAGRLHDIGKIGIREEILNKQGPLTDEEYEHVKQHVVVGSQILAPLVHLKEVITFVRSHHERWDGFGYPDRLAGDTIPLGARVIGAVEIFDALTTSRPYQEKMAAETAVERMRDLVGTVLDPMVHQALEAVVTHRQALVFLDDSTG
jgi:putative nucleotidyltransferase with HDIG domain